MSLNVFLQNLINGISLGCLFALIAIGYTMVYGILRLINFAHGDIFMMATFFAYYAIALFSLPWGLAFFAAIILTMLLGITVDRIAYRPLRDAPRISSLCSAIGMSFFLENLAIVVFGGRPKPFFSPEIFNQTFVILDIRIQSVSLITPLVSIFFLLILTYIIYRTKTGLAMRAISKDFDTAKLMGINLNRTIAFTFAIGSGLAAVGAILWALRYPQIFPFMGMFPGWRAFTAAIIGGIGSIRGAMLGGFLLGLITIMIVAFFPEQAGYKDAFVFVLLILVLLYKPEGIFGEE
ncbi:MAG: branched-chain amino acid ABC transporter permease [Candidatus Atribacteria bacterium]|jgi:branched-chain amino acid transport system permease protein|nr:branched-chain amino acid ABC transporter permease [Candidatus Atribacteria bacterium]